MVRGVLKNSSNQNHLKQQLHLSSKINKISLAGWLVGWFYGISTFVGYQRQNLFLSKK